MKRIYFFIIAFFCCLLLPLAPDQQVFAARAREGVYVYDGADLFTDGQEDELQKYLQRMGEKAGVGIYVLTSDDSNNGTSDRYLEDFYDDGYDRDKIVKDAVLMHIDMQERYVNIQAYGRAEGKIPDRTADKIIDAFYNDMRRGDYYRASTVFADKVNYYMNYVPIYLRAWVHLLAAMAVGAVVVGVMVSHSGGTVTTNSGTYFDSRLSGVRASRDDYIRTTLTKRRKPQETSRSSGGGGHVSSGVHSHSSAGRHF